MLFKIHSKKGEGDSLNKKECPHIPVKREF